MEPTLRDRFAGAALHGFISRGAVFSAKECYEIADAMLKEREKTNKE